MEKSNVERIKVNFEVKLGAGTVGIFTTMQKAKTAASVAETVAALLGSPDKAKIREVLAQSEETQQAA
jgi:hypothetical protein